MRRRRRIAVFLFFVAVLAAVVVLSNRLVEVSQKRASRRSEFSVIERVRSERADVMDKSELVKEFKEQSIREMHERFHHLPAVQEIDSQYQSQCLMCHSLLPHSKNERIRVMMNMHSDFLNCETCHDQKDHGSLQYFWYDMGIENDITRGPKFGTDYDPETGMLAGMGNHISKITPARYLGEQKEVLFMSQSHPTAKDYLLVRDKLTPGERDVAKNRFHGEIEGKGWACKECHKSEGVLDLKSLGFSEPRITELENLEIVGLFEKYEVFHLPKW